MHEHWVRFVPARSYDNAAPRADEDFRTVSFGDHADHPAAFNDETPRRRRQMHAGSRREQSFQKLRCEGNAQTSHVVASPLGKDRWVPVLLVAASAPFEHLIEGHTSREVGRRFNTVLPFSELAPRDQSGLYHATVGQRARGLVVIMVRQAMSELKADTALCEMIERDGGVVDEGHHMLVALITGAEISHIGDRLVAGIRDALAPSEAVERNPKPAGRIGRAAPDLRTFLQHDGAEAVMARRKRCRKTRDAGPYRDNVIDL